jgi:hypothetical protein
LIGQENKIQLFVVNTRHTPLEKTHRWKLKEWKTIYQASGNQKQTGITIFISDTINFNPKFFRKDKEGHCILVKGKIH